MKGKRTAVLCAAAMFTALVCVSTVVIQIPSPLGGYLNFGDCLVLVGGWVLGPLYGAAAGAVGAAMADLFCGYAVYAPATFIIKGASAAVAALAAHAAASKGHRKICFPLGAALGELLMAVGYYVYDAAVMGFGFAAAAANLPANIMQGIAGAVFGCVLIYVLGKTKVFSGLRCYLV